MHNLVQTLQVAISPAILISGLGLLLLSMTNRLGRTNDRARRLADAYRDGPAADKVRIQGQLKVLWRRAGLLRASIVWGSSAVLLVALVILLLFVSTLLGLDMAPVIAVLFGCGMVAVMLSVICFIQDINQSLRALRLELNFAEEK